MSDAERYSTCPLTVDFRNGVKQTRNITAPLVYNLYYGDDDTLTSIYIGSNVPSIGTSAFFGCSGLISVTIPNSVTSIASNAFFGCGSLTSINIPSSVTSIGGGTFRSCTDLPSITIPSSVTSIGNSAFLRCGSLTSIVVAAGNPNYSSTGPLLLNKNGTELIAGPGASGDFTIPNSVNIIKYRAFYFCASLTSITIPDSVTSLEENAFAQCTILTSITSLAVEAPTLGINVFAAAPATKIIVPVGSAQSYRDEGDGTKYGGLTIEEAT